MALYQFMLISYSFIRTFVTLKCTTISWNAAAFLLCIKATSSLTIDYALIVLLNIVNTEKGKLAQLYAIMRRLYLQMNPLAKLFPKEKWK